MTEAEFDRAADRELHALERVLSELDPDEVDVELSSGVLTLTLGDGQKVIVNSHRAARQIWMAAFRNAWHFTPQPGEGRTPASLARPRKTSCAPRSGRVLGEKLGPERHDRLMRGAARPLCSRSQDARAVALELRERCRDRSFRR